jgi:hypothetical protein
VGAEAVDNTLANLLAEDGICGDTFFFDKAFDLLYTLSARARYQHISILHLQRPTSSWPSR